MKHGDFRDVLFANWKTRNGIESVQKTGGGVLDKQRTMLSNKLHKLNEPIRTDSV